MAILGLTFDKLLAEKLPAIIKAQHNKNIETKFNIVIKKIEEDELNFQEKQKVLRVDFEFAIAYNPKIGAVELLGHLLYTDPNIKKILDVWKKEQEIKDNQVKAEIINAIFHKANLKALTLIQEVNLPPHIPLPKLLPPEQNPQSYIG